MTSQPAALSPDERQHVGDRLRLLRLERRLDQRALARMADVSLVTLQMIEKGSGRAVRVDNIQKVAQSLGTQLMDLRNAIVHDTATLNREDVEFARAFHTAILDVKLAVQTLLQSEMSEVHRKAIAQLAYRVMHAPTEHRSLFVVLLALDVERIRDLMLFAQAGRKHAAGAKRRRKNG